MLRKELEVVRRGAEMAVILSKSFVVCLRLVEKDAPKDDFSNIACALLTMTVFIVLCNMTRLVMNNFECQSEYLPAIIFGGSPDVWCIGTRRRVSYAADRFRSTSYITNAPATEALSESKLPFMGIFTRKSHFSFTNRRIPFPSFPMMMATGIE